MGRVLLIPSVYIFTHKQCSGDKVFVVFFVMMSLRRIGFKLLTCVNKRRVSV